MRMSPREQIVKIPFDVIDDNFCGLAIDFDKSENQVKEYKWNYGYQCEVCNKFCGPTKCGNCGQVIYCSRECQVASWQSHKLVCRKV
jgi:hypothetical protein